MLIMTFQRICPLLSFPIEERKKKKSNGNNVYQKRLIVTLMFFMHGKKNEKNVSLFFFFFFLIIREHPGPMLNPWTPLFFFCFLFFFFQPFMRWFIMISFSLRKMGNFITPRQKSTRLNQTWTFVCFFLLTPQQWNIINIIFTKIVIFFFM
jgi:hypothetical protein